MPTSLSGLQEVKAGEYVVAKGMTTGQNHKIYDKSFSREVSKTMLSRETFFGRIARVNDRWEFVGGNPQYIPVAMSPRMQKSYYKQSLKLIDVAKIFFGESSGEPKSSQKGMCVPTLDTGDPEKAKQRLEKEFDQLKVKYGFKGTYAGLVDLVYKENYRTNTGDFVTDCLKYLGSSPDKLDFKVFEKLVTLFFTMWNFYPHKRLKGESPNELVRKENRKG